MLQFSVSVRNAALDALVAHIGASPTLQIFSGAPPVDTDAADSGVLLASGVLPAAWMLPASNGLKVKATGWPDLAPVASGTAGHFRIRQGGVCHIQGIVSVAGAGGDMVLDDAELAIGWLFAVNKFDLGVSGA